jgi:putative sigma-54 modulation protein
MQIKISFLNMEHSNPLEAHTRQKLEKLHEHLKQSDQKPPFYVEVWLKANKLHPHHCADIHLKTSVFDLNAHDEGTDMYVAIDNTVDKILALVRKHKTKQKDKHKQCDKEKCHFTDSEDKYTLS